MTWRRHDAPICFPLAGGNRQALAPFGPTTFEYQPAVFRAHPHDEPMRATTATDVGLKSTLHRKPKCYRTGEKPVNVRPSFPLSLEGLSAAARRMLVSQPRNHGQGKAGAGVSFPQVWKKLWKTGVFCYLRPENAVVPEVPGRRKSGNPGRTSLLRRRLRKDPGGVRGRRWRKSKNARVARDLLARAARRT